ncbi:kinase suppressor of Ras 1-like isoform X3 [Anneissia japonica]|uniref:kinase suppressor of Ras 1-like isoform X3 n=1 Tax=Anneissia japonica TaxID=1529436 RepID=UPI0014258336|nr:kinase suppressor of Ras 1-like isoform X3 [Anneissia japonica]
MLVIMSENGLPSGEKALANLKDIQFLIDQRISQLRKLRDLLVRTHPSISNDRTPQEIGFQEIRTAENKLIMMFGKQLAIKSGTDFQGTSVESDYPSIADWMCVVNIRQDVLQKLCQPYGTLKGLLDIEDSEMRELLKNHDCSDNDIQRLSYAMKNLKEAYRAHLQGGENTKNLKMTNLDSGSPAGSETEINEDKSEKRPSVSSSNSDIIQENVRVPITPPPIDYHPKLLDSVAPPPTPTSKRTKSKGTPPPSKKVFNVHGVILDGSSSLPSRTQRVRSEIVSPGSSCEAIVSRLKSEDESDPGSGQTSPRKSSPGRQSDANSLTVPRRNRICNMTHSIKHRKFHTFQPYTLRRSRWYTMKKNVLPTRFVKKTMITKTCDYCHEKIVISGVKCKDCKYTCHSRCEPSAELLPSCGLPRKYEEIFKESITHQGYASPSPIFHRRPAPIEPPQQSPENQTSLQAFAHGESSSNPSSTTSSTPSSPVPLYPSSASATPPSVHSPHVREFDFGFVNDVTLEPVDTRNVETSQSSDQTITVDSQESHDSPDTNTDSEKTLPGKWGSIDSNVSDSELNEVSHRKGSKSSVLSEWDIPVEKLDIKDLIGTGRFGKVYKGYWHGDVAVRKLDIDSNNEEERQAFKKEVLQLKRTRHDYLVLFMGTCKMADGLAIVTSLCRGPSLYIYIHVKKEKFTLAKSVGFATQILQGMGYLHAKGIIHKDLRSKNIFVEKGLSNKVVIADYSIFSVARLSKENKREDCLQIPKNWLCYLAPELIKALKVKDIDGELPFSKASDVYAFGTVWYELLAKEFPMADQENEAIIFQVGQGMKPILSRIQASRDVKDPHDSPDDILMMCWNYTPSARPSFSALTKTLDRLPKRRIMRSPSTPLHLSRSAESVF